MEPDPEKIPIQESYRETLAQLGQGLVTMKAKAGRNTVHIYNRYHEFIQT